MMRVIANGFALEMPQGWEDRTMTTLIGVQGPGGFVPNVVVVRERVPANTRLEGYARAQLEYSVAELPGLEVISERTIDLRGTRAIVRVQRFTSAGRSIQQSQAHLIAAPMAYVVTCSAEAVEFETNLPAFDAIMNSLAFFDPRRATLC